VELVCFTYVWFEQWGIDTEKSPSHKFSLVTAPIRAIDSNSSDTFGDQPAAMSAPGAFAVLLHMLWTR
jgi:hypothetical protein